MNYSRIKIVLLITFTGSIIGCSSDERVHTVRNHSNQGRSIDYKHPDKDVVVKKRESWSKSGESVFQFLLIKESLKEPASDQEIKQMIVKVTSNRSLTEPEFSKLMLITGTLYEDLGNTNKAREYYKREIELADKVLAKSKDIQWLQSKIEAFIMLNDKKSLVELRKSSKESLSETDFRGIEPWFDVTKEELFKHYSFKVMSKEKYTVR